MNWLDGLATEVITDKVPKDFYTCQQIADLRGLSVARTSELLRKAMREGSVQMRKFRVKSGRVVPHYGPANTSAKRVKNQERF